MEVLQEQETTVKRKGLLNNMQKKMQRKNTLDKVTLIKILKGAGIAGGGAALVYLLQAVVLLDFGDYTPMVVAIAGILINAIKEFISGK